MATGFPHDNLDSFTARVGDVVAEGDAIGAVGSSGVGTATDHLHLVAYHGLVKTYVKKEKVVSPFQVLSTGLSAAVDVGLIDPTTVEVVTAVPMLDAVRFEFTGTAGSHVIDFETGEGLCGDLATCEGVTIAPSDFNVRSTESTLTFYLPALDTLTAVEVYDSAGDLVGSW